MHAEHMPGSEALPSADAAGVLREALRCAARTDVTDALRDQVVAAFEAMSAEQKILLLKNDAWRWACFRDYRLFGPQEQAFLSEFSQQCAVESLKGTMNRVRNRNGRLLRKTDG